MKRLLSIITAASVLMTAYSCAEVSPDSDATGFLSVNVEENNPDITYVKSTEAENRTIALKIYDNVGDLVKEAEDYTSLGKIELRTGFYHAVASSGENPTGAAFDAPFYSGESDFTIRRGQTESLDIVCRLANIRVTVALAPEITEKFSKYVFVVKGNDGSSLEYNQDLDNFAREGYFPGTVTGLEWSLSLVSNTDIAYKTITGKYDNVKPCQHYKFNFTLVEENPSTDIGGSIFTIRLDDSLNQKDYDLNLDFGKNDGNPVISGGDIDLSDVRYHTGDILNVNISSKTKISSLVLSHDDQVLENAGMPRSTEFVGIGQDVLAALEAKGIKTSGIVPYPAVRAEDTPENADFDFTGFLASLPEGQYSFAFHVMNEDAVMEEQVNVKVLGAKPAVTMQTVSVDEVWAKFAKVTGSYDSDEVPAGLGFSFKPAAGSSWATASSVTVDESSKTFTAEIRGLEPSSDYIVKAVCTVDGAVEGEELTFATESAEIVPNLGFDDWYQDGKIWFPGVGADNCFWDTANKGSSALSVFPTTPEESVVISGKAARLESKQVAMVGLAAGNIYTGKFVKAIMNLSNPGAELDWGVPFTSRPLALKGHYQYAPQAINKTKAPYENMSGKTDVGQIQIMLTDWDGPFRISTSEGKFVDINDSHIIGYGTMDLNATSGYQEFKINVDYRDRTRKPTYIVIVASASKYGDYFTGGVGSTLYLDEFELVYDPE